MVRRERKGRRGPRSPARAFESIKHDNNDADLAADCLTAWTAWIDEPPVVATSSTIATVEPGSSGPSIRFPVPCALCLLTDQKTPEAAPSSRRSQGQRRTHDGVRTHGKAANGRDGGHLVQLGQHARTDGAAPCADSVTFRPST